jgi:general stress protein CsbA
MILSRFCLHTRYRVQHLGGAAVCLIGMVGLVLTDVLVGKNDNQGWFSDYFLILLFIFFKDQFKHIHLTLIVKQIDGFYIHELE